MKVKLLFLIWTFFDIMGGNICQYIGCGNSNFKNREIKVFKFPAKSDPDRARTWIINSGNVGLSQLSADALKTRVICNKHFEDHMFRNKSRSSLIHNAVPIKYKDEITRNKKSPKVQASDKIQPSDESQPLHPALNQRFLGSVMPTGRPILPLHSSPSQNTSRLSSFNINISKNIFPSSKGESYSSSINENHLQSISPIDPSLSPLHFSSTSQSFAPGNNCIDKVQTPKRTYLQSKESGFNFDSSISMSFNFNSLPMPSAVHFLTPTHPSTPQTKQITPSNSVTPKSSKFVRDLIDLPDRCIKRSWKRKLELCDEGVEDTPKTKKIKRANRTIEHLRRTSHNKSATINRLRSQKTKMKGKPNSNEFHYNDLNFLSDTSRILVQMQLRSRSSKKFRWSKEERKFAMSFYYKSPATYKHMRRNGVILPGVSTVKKWFQSIRFLPGLNDVFFEHLKAKCSTMTEMEKACTIIFDEMSIMKCIEYNKSLDYIEGFQDLGESLERANALGTHALVVMIRGLYSKWKLPLAYFITGKGMEGEDLKRILENTVKKLVSIGFDPKVVTCDQGPENRNFYSLLGVTSDNYKVNIGGKEIFFMYDVPHLMKSLRNNLLTGNFFYDDKTISFADVRKTYEIDSQSNTSRAMLKITPTHLHPNAFKRMSCKLALQIFSHSVAAAIKTAHKTGQLKSETAVNTADFFLMLNNLFDTLNSSNLCDPNPYKKPLSENNIWQFKLFSDIIKIFKSLVKISHRKNSKTKKVEIKTSRPPCFEGLLQTVRAVRDLFLQESNIYKSKFSGKNTSESSAKVKTRSFFLMTIRLNQDPLENFFSVVRQKNGYNRNPTVRLFRCSFAHIAHMSFFKYSNLGNCQIDNDDFLDFDHANNETNTVNPSETGNTDTNPVDPIIDDEYDDDCDVEDEEDDDEDEEDPIELCRDFIEEADPTLESCANVYVAGYLAYSALKKCECSDCKTLFLNDKKEKITLPDEQQTLLVFRTFENITDSKKGLKVPSVILVNIVNMVLQLCTDEIRTSPQKKNFASSIFELAKKKIKRKFSSFCGKNSDPLCQENRYSIIKLLIRTKIYKDCKRLSTKMYSKTEKPQPRLRILQGN